MGMGVTAFEQVCHSCQVLGRWGHVKSMWSVVRGIWVAQPQRPSLSGWLGQRTVRLVFCGGACITSSDLVPHWEGCVA
jgi:hypothetical protein